MVEWNLQFVNGYHLEINFFFNKCSTFHCCYSQEDQKKEEEKAKNRIEESQLPLDQYNLVCLKHWEDDIIWSSEDYRPKENSSALRSLAGWIPSSNGRTMQAYLTHLANKSKNKYQL